MKSTLMILLVHEVAALCRVAPVTIYRWLAERRAGRGQFPLPLAGGGSGRSGKLRWLASDIESFLLSQSNPAPPIKVASASERRREAKVHKQRQEAAEVALARHRKAKGGH